MELEAFLSEKFNLPASVLEDLLSAGKREVFSKKELVLRPFKVSKQVYFVEKGLIKMFYDKETRSITHSFVSENQFIGRSDIFFADKHHKNSMYGLMALENNTTVHTLPFSKIQFLAQANLEINRLIQDILIHHLISFSNRLSNIQFEDAKMRYEQLLEDQPDIILRAPLGDIASYLGISQQTLSVIRAKIQ